MGFKKPLFKKGSFPGGLNAAKYNCFHFYKFKLWRIRISSFPWLITNCSMRSLILIEFLKSDTE